MRVASSLLAALGAIAIALPLSGLSASAQAPTEEPQATPAAPVSPTAAASPAASPDASPASSAAASPMVLASLCEVWTVDEVSAALSGHAVTVDPATESALSCAYQSSTTAGSLTESVMAGLTFEDERTGPLVDVVRQTFPDAAEIEVAGAQAIPGPTTPGAGEAEGWTVATLFVFPDPLVLLQLQATTPPDVDAEAVLVALAELAVPRLAGVQPPAASPSPAASVGPAPSVPARTGLAGLFPSEVGGSPVTVDLELTGEEFLARMIDFRPMERRLTRALRQRDRRLADLTFAQGSTANGSAILAFQVRGAQIRPLVDLLLESLGMERIDKDVRPQDVAGKSAFAVLSGAEGVAYAQDDVLWIVFSQVPELTEIFGKLP